jgi:membrane AbrB-like protein
MNPRGRGAWRRSLQWLALLALSALISAGWSALGLPAALLLGPMIGGIAFGVNGANLDVPRAPNLGAQAMIGAMVAASITPSILVTFGHHYLLFCVVMLGTLLGAAAIGWLVSRTGLIPGATAVYGISPGAAGAMVLLGEAEGADPRLVAFMQYSRVLLVAVAAALVARFWAHVGSGHAPGAPWLSPVHWGNLGLVFALALIGQQIARLLRLQAWALLGPMLLLSALHAAGWLPIDLPRWVLAAAYALLGWRIGLGFRRDALLHAGPVPDGAVRGAGLVPGAAGAHRCTDCISGDQSRRTRLGGHHCRHVSAGGPAVRARPAGGTTGIRHLPGTAHHAPGGQALTASADCATLNHRHVRSERVAPWGGEFRTP